MMVATNIENTVQTALMITNVADHEGFEWRNENIPTKEIGAVNAANVAPMMIFLTAIHAPKAGYTALIASTITRIGERRP